MAIKTAYKVTTAGGEAHHGGRGRWTRPNGRPGAWKTARGVLVPCRNGLHLCRKQDLVYWLGPAIWLAEYDDSEMLTADNKIVVRKARLVEALRWDKRIARLFAADCAEYALRALKRNGIVMTQEPFSAAIRAARAFAEGKTGQAEMRAAYSAAYSAPRSAVYSAAYSAADSATYSAADSAAYSAYLAAYSAPRSAVYLAAYSAARSAARRWQTKRLFEYLGGKRG